MKYYFASDVHLGLKLEGLDEREQEKQFVAWLDLVEHSLLPTTADDKKGALFLLGDIFDFWFEYRNVVPKGHVRTLGKLSQMCDKGIEVHFFVGNHDTWCCHYLEQEVGVILHKQQQVITLCGKRCLVGHGHRLSMRPINYQYQLMTAIFNSTLLYHLHSWIVHPDINIAFGSLWSRQSRKKKSFSHAFGGEKEFVVRYARNILEKDPIDYFIFGHFHTPTLYALSDQSQLIVLGQWLDKHDCRYAVLDEQGISLQHFENK